MVNRILKLKQGLNIEDWLDQPQKALRQGIGVAIIFALGIILGLLNAFFFALPQAVEPLVAQFDAVNVSSSIAITPVSGWWVKMTPNNDSPNQAVVRGVGSESIVSIILPRAGAYRLVIVLSHESTRTTTNPLSVYLNGSLLGELVLPIQAEAQSFELIVPRGAVQPGVNMLRFVYTGEVTAKDQPNDFVFHSIIVRAKLTFQQLSSILGKTVLLVMAQVLVLVAGSALVREIWEPGWFMTSLRSHRYWPLKKAMASTSLAGYFNRITALPIREVRLTWKPIVLWFLSMLPAFLLFLHSSALVPLGWERKALPNTSMQTVSGFSYAIPLNTKWMSQSDLGRSPAQVLENNQPLPFSNAVHAEIVEKGLGRYSVWDGLLYFSTSDNSNPLTNGRRYELYWPIPLAPGLLWASYGLALTVTLSLSWRYRITLIQTITQAPFYLSALILVFVFLVTRLPFLVYYPLVGLAPDTGNYVQLAIQITQGGWPLFETRTPGYPLFIWLFTLVWDRWLVAIATQHLLSLLSSLCIVYGVYRLRPSLTLPAALAMAVFLGNPQVLIYDSYALSESLYTSSLLFSFGFLLLGLSRSHSLALVLSSTAMAQAILVRPAGMFLLVIYGLVAAFLIWNTYPKKAIWSFSLPMPALLFTLCVYNYVTLGAFTISPWGEGGNLALATISFWETDPSFPPPVNQAIEELPAAFVERVGFTRQDREIINSSWDPHQLLPAFSKVYTGLFYEWSLGERFDYKQSGNVYMNNRLLIRQIILSSIKKHPDLYAKFVWANLWYYYFENINLRMDFYAFLSDVAIQYYQAKRYTPSGDLASQAYVAKEYADAIPPPAIKLTTEGDNTRIILTDTPLKLLHTTFQSWHWNLFQHRFWVIAYFGMLGLSVIKLGRSRGRHLGAFIIFILTISVFGASLIVCLVEIALERYAYPMQFVYYLGLALLPLLLTRPKISPS